MKILMHFSDWAYNDERKKQNTYGGIGYVRIIKIAEQIKDHDVTIVGREFIEFGDGTLEGQLDSIFKEYDVFWTNYFADDRLASAIFFFAEKYGKKVVIDIDDNYLDVPESNIVHETFKLKEKRRAFLSTVLALADMVVVSTEPLRDRLRQHFKERPVGLNLNSKGEKAITVIPNMNDWEDWNYTPAEKTEDTFVIGYTGSNSHQDDLKMVMPSIATIMKKYQHVHFELIGAVAKDKIKETFGRAGFDDSCLARVAMLPATPTFREYPLYLSEHQWNVGIAPLVDTAFTRCKSHVKWMEYSMFKFPTIASRVYPYFMELWNRETIVDGETGLLVKDTEWINALEKLITNPKIGEELGEKAYKAVRKNWQYKDSDINQVVNDMLLSL